MWLSICKCLLIMFIFCYDCKAPWAKDMIAILIIYMKKLLDSDWLRAVQFKCNTSAKSVPPVQITHRNSGL